MDKPVLLNEVLFFTGLLANQPNITPEEAEQLADKFREEKGDLDRLNAFLIQEYQNFALSPNGKKKKIKIVEA